MNDNGKVTKFNAVNKDSYALNLTEKTHERFIKQVEDSITANKTLLSEKMPGFKEVEELYLNEKKVIDELNEKIDDDTLLLEGLVRFRGRNANKHTIRVLRTTSHNDDKHKGENVSLRENWIKLSAQVLIKYDKFMSAEEIFDAILDTFPDVAKNVRESGRIGTIKSRTIINLKVTAEKERKIGIPLLRMYKDLIGLNTWMKGKTPVESRMKQFMYQKEARA